MPLTLVTQVNTAEDAQMRSNQPRFRLVPFPTLHPGRRSTANSPLFALFDNVPYHLTDNGYGDNWRFPIVFRPLIILQVPVSVKLRCVSACVTYFRLTQTLDYR